MLIRILQSTLVALIALPCIQAADLPRISLGEDGAVTSLRIAEKTFTSAKRMGLFVRESPDGEWLPIPLADGKDATADLTAQALRINAQLKVKNDLVLISGAVEDMRGKEDRAVDVALRLPFDSAVWWSGISDRVAPDEEPRPTQKRRTQEQIVEGAAVLEPLEDGGLAQNFMPIGCVTSTDETAGLAVALPPDAPCRFRFAYLRDQGCQNSRQQPCNQ